MWGKGDGGDGGGWWFVMEIYPFRLIRKIEFDMYKHVLVKSV